MKKLVIATIAFISFSCNNTTEKKEEPTKENKKEATAKTTTTTDEKAKPTVKNSDTVFVTQKALLIHDASKAEVEKWQKEGGENFGESLSDNLHYIDETNTAAKKMQLNIIRTEGNIIAFVKKDGSKVVFTRGKNFEGWGAIAFNESASPKTIDITNSQAELEKYFAK